MKKYIALLVLLITGCVNIDPETGKTIPREDQSYKFETVKRNAEKLRNGMSKLDARLLLGSPAEKSSDGNVWVYLPERPAVLIPSKALHLEFESNILIKHGYKPIILGQTL